MGAVVALVLLSLPVGHQVKSHRVLRRVLRVTRPTPSPEDPPTAHELAHRSRSLPLRVAANVAWLLYLAGAVAVAYVLR